MLNGFIKMQTVETMSSHLPKRLTVGSPHGSTKTPVIKVVWRGEKLVKLLQCREEGQMYGSSIKEMYSMYKGKISSLERLFNPIY